MRKNVLLLFSLLTLSGFSQQTRYTLSGYVSEAGSGELLIGVNIYVPVLKSGTVSNAYGFYSITLPEGKYRIVYSYVGFKADTFDLNLNKSVERNVKLVANSLLQVVEITGSAEKRISQDVHMSTVDIPVQQMKSLPALLGERDVFKTLQLLPGVQKGNEGSTGIYVRGGGPDQNLIILDDALVYNANHLFGFFSVFNGDALKSIELMKGGFPARFGGRLSSVVEMNMKEGNKEKIAGEAGIGLLSSRLTLEGPILKNKSSFLVSGRRTYLDVLTRPFMSLEDGVGGYYFYDLNAKVNYDFGSKNKVYLSGYFGRDKFFVKYKDNYDGSSDELSSGFFWQNATATARWNHLFNNKLFSNTSLIFSNYNMSVYIKEKYDNDFFNLRYLSGIQDFSLKNDYSWYISPEHHIRFGAILTHHRFRPSALTLKSSYIDESFSKVTTINALESGLYAEDEMHLGSRVMFNPGIRFSMFNTASVTYFNPEPRLSFAYVLNEYTSLKASYAMMSQYVHLISNTGIGLPTDLWVPSSAKIKPQRSQQIALGLARDLPKQNLTLTVEGYYKIMNNIIGYLDGASYLLIDDPYSASESNWEENVTSGKGKSYGVEMMLQRKTGKFSGWVAYTLSWTKHQFEEINFGKEFWARYDRRHDISVVGLWNPTDKISVSGTWVYSSGNAITLPLATYTSSTHNPYSFGGYYGEVTDYGERNSFRMRAYHRLDLSVQFHKEIRWGHRTFEIGIYNVYNRKNPYFYFLESEYDSDGNQKNVLKQVSVFPIIPSITYTLKF